MGAPGCDDAPLVTIDSMPHGDCKTVTMIYPYYDNPKFLIRQINWWWDWPEQLRQHVRLIVVDDCSPGTPARSCFTANKPFETRVFRIEKDVRWNWLAARNIGAFYSGQQPTEHDGGLTVTHFDNSKWLLLTDMDHIVGPGAMETLIRGQHDPNIIYRFSRRDRKPAGDRVAMGASWIETAIHPHPNSWFMTRRMFWRVGGYDERMSGFYGSDSYYRRRCAATAPIRIMANAALVRQEHDGDSSTLGYKRKQPEDAKLRPLVRSFGSDTKPRVLTFPYHEEAI